MRPSARRISKDLLPKDLGITYSITMSKVKVAISIDGELLKGVDSLVSKRVFPNRSRAIAEAVREKLQRVNRDRLARECAKLDPQYEQEMAEEGIVSDLAQWPEY
jgi:Arc/MetJ-type ribon-helix-helix transcriptional regulator